VEIVQLARTRSLPPTWDAKIVRQAAHRLVLVEVVLPARRASILLRVLRYYVRTVRRAPVLMLQVVQRVKELPLLVRSVAIAQSESTL